MKTLRIFLLAALILVVFAAKDVEADEWRDPVWSYTMGGEVGSVAISADGEYIALGTLWGDNKIYLFDKDSDTPLWNFTASDIVKSVAISADGEYIVAGADPGTVYLFGKDSNTPLWNYATTADNSVQSVSISADGEYIAAAYAPENKVYLFGKDSDTPLWNYTTGDWVESVAISADGEYIVAGSLDNKVYLFDKDSDTPLWNYTTPSGSSSGVKSVAISADGEYITAGSWNGNVYFFHQDSSTPLWHSSTGAVWSIDISADGEYIVVGSFSGTASLFDNNGTRLLSDSHGSKSSVSISDDGAHILIGGGDDIKLFGKDRSKYPKEGDTLLWRSDSDAMLNYIIISADGGYIVAADSDKIYLYENYPPDYYYDLHYEYPDYQYENFIVIEGREEGVSLGCVSNWGEFNDEVILSFWKFDDWEFNMSNSWVERDIDGGYNVRQYGGRMLAAGDTVCIYALVKAPSHSEGDEITLSGFIDSGGASGGQWLNGEMGWFSVDLYVTIIHPEARIDSITPSKITTGSTVFFDGSGYDYGEGWDSGGDGIIIAYTWKSSIDGDLSMEKNFSISDLSPGNHTITFRVQDSDGFWSGPDSRVITVSEKGEDESSLPSVSMIPVLISIGLIARYRRK